MIGNNSDSASPEFAAHLGRVLDATSSEIYFLDVETLRFTRANRAALANLGFTDQELSGMGPWDLSARANELDIQRRLAPLRSREVDEIAYESKHRRKDGTLYDIELKLMLSRSNGVDVIVGIAQDVTARKQAEQETRESEERFRATFEQAAVGISHVAPDGRWLRVNQKLCEIVGYSREELLQRSFHDITHPDDIGRDTEAVAKMLSGAMEAYSSEKRYVRKDGSVVWVNLTTTLVRTGSGQQEYFVAVTEDISARRHAEEDLRASEGRQRAMLAAMPDMVFVLSRNGTHLNFHAPSPDALFAPPGTIIGRSVDDLLPPEVSADYLRNIAATLDQRTMQLFEYQLTFAEGGCRHYEARMVPHSDEAVLVVVREVTGRKRAEEALEASEAELRALFASSEDLIMIIAPGGRILRLNRPAIRTQSPAGPYVAGRSLFSYVRPEDEKRFRDAIATAIAGGTATFELEGSGTPDDEWFELRFSPVHAPGGASAVAMFARDMTARRAAERALVKNQERLTLATRGTELTVWDTDLLSHTTVLEGSLSSVLGFEEGIPVPDAEWTERVHPDDRLGLRQEWVRLLKNETSLQDYEYRLRAQSGNWIWVHSRARIAERDSAGRALRAVGTYVEVTARKEAELALQASDAHARELATIVESAPYAIATYAPDRTVLTWNPAAEVLFGYSAEEVVGRISRGVVSEEMSTATDERYLPILESGEPVLGVVHPARHRDGHQFELEASMFPIRSSDGPMIGYAVSAQDVSGRKQQENRNLLLAELANMLNQDLPIESLVAAVLDSLERALAVDYAGFVEALPGGEEVRVVGSRPALVQPDGAIISRRGTAIEWLGDTQDVVEYRTDRVETDGAVRLRDAGIIRMAAAVVRDGDSILGEFTVGRGESKRYTPEEREFLLTLAHLLGQAVGNRRRAAARLAAETALRESEEKYRDLFNNAEVGMFRARLDGSEMLEVNDKVLEIVGRLREQVVGQPSILQWVDLSERDDMIRRLSAEDRVTNFEFRLLTKHGEVRHCLASFRLDRMEAIIEGSIVDITERVQAEQARVTAENALRESEQKYRTLFENAQIGMFRLRMADAQLIEANDRLSAMAGFETFDAVPADERLLDRVLPAAVRAEEILGRLVANGEIHGEDVPFERADGSFGTARVSARLEPGGEIAQGVAVDVSDEVAAREAVLALNADLERRVEQRTAELQQALAELESFSYTVSHDLRAPLRAIQGFSQAALKEVGPELGERGTHLLSRVVAGTDRMSSLINDILSLSRVSRAPLQRTVLDLSMLAKAAAEHALEGQPRAAARLTIADGIFEEGDRALVSIALQNLFENAAKFSGSVAEPRVEFGFGESASERYFYVRDNGVGFNQEYADRMFKPFQRLHPASEFEGTGIGLATVERIVRRHGGRVWAEGNVGQGATIYFTLQPRGAS